MSFRASFADPFNPEFVDLGPLSATQILHTFSSTPWKELLTKMDATPAQEVFHSPSLEVERTEQKHGLCISAIDGQVWLLFYKRPKLITKRSLFGKKEIMEPDYLNEKTVQDSNEVLHYLQALLDGELEKLEQMFG
ncbi:MAG: hypothetical protein IM638_12285 [Bacteroidetes bacterium]|nr:hypothetical protein [Bacteroidota bacterium]